MTERRAVVGHPLGLHARVAAKLVQLTSRYQSEVALRRADVEAAVEADARSILSLLFLAARHGSTLIVRANGPDEEAAVEGICEYLKG